uniref:Nuclear condensin complex subunit 3 C-terminal domain-containing protein n=1 Tax=Rhodosorus marinus TaxID=101924 RepID=A0A7S3ELP4_9RHOD|mmetsp:Transcript_4779/g.20495  ORF Transcript_4779/g.20495 Transcript_4779/m.20495 type:complete len:745 (+) Transcript_4779:290-2524(+)
MTDAVTAEVRACFQDGQRSFASHKRIVQRLSVAFARDRKIFWKEFIRAVNRVLVIYARTAAVERVVQLIATFAGGHSTATSSDERQSGLENFCSALIAYLLERTSATSKAVRFRSCQLVSTVLTSLPDNAEINEQLYEPLVEKLMSRAKDKVPTVRAATISGLGRLQNPIEDAEDEVASQLVFMMSYDSSPAVRKAALSFTMISTCSVAAFVRRCHDVREDVRKTALRILANRVHPQSLPIASRVEILRAGLHDRSSAVRKTCLEVLLRDGWLRDACGGDLIRMISYLDPEIYSNVAIDAARLLVTASEELLMKAVGQINPKELTAETAVLLRACVASSDFIAETFFPSTLTFVEALKCTETTSFMQKQLLDIAGSVDMTDEVGRQELERFLLEDLIPNIDAGSECLRSAVSVLRRSSSIDTVERMALNAIEGVKLSEEEHEDEANIANEESLKQTEAKLRALEVVEALLSHKGELSDRQQIQMAVLNGFTSSNSVLRASALQCLSVLCLREKEDDEALRFLPLFVQVCGNDTAELRLMAMKCMVDFLMAFRMEDRSSEGENPEENGNDSTTPSGKALILSLLLDNLLHSDSEMRTVAAEGLARLLFCARIEAEPEILSKLLLLFFNPATEDDDLHRQSMSVFFPAFAARSQTNRSLFEEALILTLNAISSAPSVSPIASVDPVEMSLYTFYLLELNDQPLKRTVDSETSSDSQSERYWLTDQPELINEPTTTKRFGVDAQWFP